MPLYDYRCSACGKFEAMRKVSQRDEPMNCPTCDETAERVTASAPHVRSQGANFGMGPDFLSGSGSGSGGEGAGSYGMRHRGGCLCC